MGIEPTTDRNLIRSAYRKRLPEYHPERDPAGFQILRGAYEAALNLACETPLDTGSQSADQDDAETHALRAFDAVIEDPARRYDLHAWEAFIQQLGLLPLEMLQSVSWRLLAELLERGPMSHQCVGLLAQHLGWAEQLLDVDFDSAQRIDQFLQRIQQPDPFDLALMGGWSAPAQLEALWYIRNLDHLYQHRPLDEYRYFASLHTCVPLPADSQLVGRLLAQFTHAGIGGRGLREVIVDQHRKMPDDLDGLYLATSQCTLLGQEEEALRGWIELWRRFQHPKAAVWLLALCARHQPQRLPLLIQAFDCHSGQQDLSCEPHGADQAVSRLQMRPETLARWHNVLRQRLPGIAGAYAVWVMGGDHAALLASLNDGQADTGLLSLYRHAWALHCGDLSDLQQVLLQAPLIGVLDELIIEGFRYQAQQRIDRLPMPRGSFEREGLSGVVSGEPLASASPWAVWRFGSRLGRKAFIGQVAAVAVFGMGGLLFIHTAPIAAITLMAFTLLLLAGAVLRRLHDMGRGLPTLVLGAALTLILPFVPAVLFLWPGNCLPNRYGHPPGKPVATISGDDKPLD
ncbi:DUF805 domain-containing protein [Pseudomonas sp. SIMBA_059]